MVEGGSSPSRGPANYGAYPLFIERGSGSRLYDVDGNEYVDWMMAYGALPLGHAAPARCPGGRRGGRQLGRSSPPPPRSKSRWPS